MEEFDDLQDALDFTAMNLIPRRHSYIVDISSVEEAGSERNCNLQIVPEHFVIEGGSYGLTVHLPFNRSSEKFAALSQLLKSNLAEHCVEYETNGIPCFALSCGADSVLVEKVVRFLLVGVYGYKSMIDFEFTGYDEGPD